MDFILKKQFSIYRTVQVTGGIIWLLEKLYGTKSLENKLDALRQLNSGSVGREVANLLDSKGYRLIPKFEDHDLKHVVLEYGMTMKDEIRMQVYLIGNGNYTFPCLLFLCLGIFYPLVWVELPNHYRQGKRSASIHFLRLDDCKHKSSAEIKEEYGRKTSNI